MALTSHQKRLNELKARSQRLGSRETDLTEYAHLLPVVAQEGAITQEDVSRTLSPKTLVQNPLGQTQIVEASKAPFIAGQGAIALDAEHEVAITYVPIDDLRPGTKNNRKYYDPQKLDELAASIRENGVLQPILVRPVKIERIGRNLYEVVGGERRFRAVQIAGLKAVPCIIRYDVSDLTARQIDYISNMHEQLSVIEKGDALIAMRDEMNDLLELWLRNVEDDKKYNGYLKKISSMPWERVMQDYLKTPEWIRDIVLNSKGRRPKVSYEDAGGLLGFSPRQTAYFRDIAGLPENVADHVVEEGISQRQAMPIANISKLRVLDKTGGRVRAERDLVMALQLVLAKEVGRHKLSGDDTEELKKKLMRNARLLQLTKREQRELAAVIRSKNWSVASTIEHLATVHGYPLNDLVPADGLVSGEFSLEESPEDNLADYLDEDGAETAVLEGEERTILSLRTVGHTNGGTYTVAGRPSTVAALGGDSQKLALSSIIMDARQVKDNLDRLEEKLQRVANAPEVYDEGDRALMVSQVSLEVTASIEKARALNEMLCEMFPKSVTAACA